MDRILDLKGLQCPLPVLRARKALLALGPGEVIVVLATDPAARDDFPRFCSEAGHVLEEASEAGGVLTFRLRKGKL